MPESDGIRIQVNVAISRIEKSITFLEAYHDAAASLKDILTLLSYESNNPDVIDAQMQSLGLAIDEEIMLEATTLKRINAKLIRYLETL